MIHYFCHIIQVNEHRTYKKNNSSFINNINSYKYYGMRRYIIIVPKQITTVVLRVQKVLRMLHGRHTMVRQPLKTNGSLTHCWLSCLIRKLIILTFITRAQLEQTFLCTSQRKVNLIHMVINANQQDLPRICHSTVHSLWLKKVIQN